MRLFGRGRRAAPRIVPELADPELGRVLSQTAAAVRATDQDFVLAAVEQLLHTTGPDWDRCTHRLLVLARSDLHSVAHTWRSRCPDDPFALLLHVWSCLHTSAVDRSPGELRDLARLCRRSTDLLPAHPAPWVALLAVLRRMRRPAHQMFEIWGEAVVRDPWHRETHRQMLRYLSPEECGSTARALDFVDDVRAGMPPGTPAAGLHLAALTDNYLRVGSHSGTSGLGVRHCWSTPAAAQALDEAALRWIEPRALSHAAAPADLNLLAYALVAADRTAEASEVFRTLGAVVTPWPWGVDADAVQRFTHWQERLLP
ncbi:hypothetical protein [Kitasatospora sp. NPDC059571]|uniref:hypothetical protein n=1 Tax=Kitasatospora sp. NPDC059571 TaxID=3346871 RepID=UPI0036BD50D9